MNREQAKKLAPIIKAFGEGSEVQNQVHMVPFPMIGALGDTKWQDTDNPDFEYGLIRLKPKPREFTLCFRPDGWVHVNEDKETVKLGAEEIFIKVREILDDE